MNEIDLVKRMLEREKRARKEAEALMEQKGRELYVVNQGLRQMAEELTEARNLAPRPIRPRVRFWRTYPLSCGPRSTPSSVIARC